MNQKQIEAMMTRMMKLAPEVAELAKEFVELRELKKHRLLERDCILAAFSGLLASGPSTMTSAVRTDASITLGRSLAKSIADVEKAEDAPLHEGIERAAKKGHRKTSKPKSKTKTKFRHPR